MAMAQMILAKRLTTQTFVADPYQEDWFGPALLTSGRGGLRVLFRPSERGGACQEAWCSRAFLTSGLARTILFVRESALLANGSGGGRFPCRRQPAKDTRYTSAAPPPRATSTKLSAVCRRAPTSMPRKKQVRLRERAIKTPRAPGWKVTIPTHKLYATSSGLRTDTSSSTSGVARRLHLERF